MSRRSGIIREEECWSCEGSGLRADGQDADCRVCKGRGQIAVKEPRCPGIRPGMVIVQAPTEVRAQAA